MKNSLLLFVVVFLNAACSFSQNAIEKTAKNFQFNWNEYLLPKSSFFIYHGKRESYFIDSKGNRVIGHTYLDIKTGGKHHFIVQNDEGFHILDTSLTRVTEKAFDKIQLNHGWEVELTFGDKTSFYSWSYESKSYEFTDIQEPTPPWATSPKRTYNLKLGEVNDSRFKSKRIERLRLGIDMSKTLSTEQKGKNVLVKKDGNVVYKGPSKPMLYYDFMITATKSPHSLYHPKSKKPILENCDRFWCVKDFLVVSMKGSLVKHIVSSKGDIVLTSSGEIRYYDYEFGGQQYAFFCDGRSVVNLKGDLIYRSDGELVGVAEHYIYTGNSGAYLGDLSQNLQMNCMNFQRFGSLTVGQLGNKSWRLFDAKSVLINEFNDFFYSKSDSVLVCAEDNRTIIANPHSGKIYHTYSAPIRAQKSNITKEWRFYAKGEDEDGTSLEGRFTPKKGVVIPPKYLKIEWPESESYYIVVTKEGDIRYLKNDGQELFD